MFYCASSQQPLIKYATIYDRLIASAYQQARDQEADFSVLDIFAEEELYGAK
jgi:hypothetical protein